MQSKTQHGQVPPFTDPSERAAPAKPLLVRDVFFRFLEGQGVRYFFGNPGTTELPLVDGVNDHPEIGYVLALHEDIAVAMAMGYARTSGKPGVVNLHVAPGLGHGLGNLYNAWRARMPLVVTAGPPHPRRPPPEALPSPGPAGLAPAVTQGGD